MVVSTTKAAKLTRDRLSQVKALERKLGVVLVALEPEYSVAHLRGDQLKRIQAIEKDIGLVLVAYERP